MVLSSALSMSEAVYSWREIYPGVFGVEEETGLMVKRDKNDANW